MTGFVRKQLPELIRELPVEILSTSELPGVEVCGVTEDSREVRTNFIFVAVKGFAQDGHRYIPQAITQGANAVIGTDPIQDLPIPYVQVRDAREALAYLAAEFYGFPGRHLTMIGVTGTDGKTTTSNLIYQILLSAKLPTGIVSTVNAQLGSETVDTGFHVTTPRASDIQHYLSRMRAAGLSYAILETTSHGLSQHRVTGCEFDIAVLTNITHEHIDNHGSFDAYRDAKTSLFAGLTRRAPKPVDVEPLAVLNRDDPSYDYVRERTRVRHVSYALNEKADLWAEDIRHDALGLHFIAHGPGFQVPVDCRIMGLFNVSNCLAAIGASVIGLHIDPEAAREGIANLSGVPGRMEQINMGQPFIAIVDFAHTPNALKNALMHARSMTPGRLITVFGSAGLRDREKRRMMAEVSTELADLSIFTAEDPRTEPLDGILEEMANGAKLRGGVEGRSFLRVRDRGEAIRQAVQMVNEGDLVIVCGKGHEQSMCFGTEEYAWDDRVAMRAALAERLSATGPRMPYLPTQDL